jgi:hypothetical protein
MGRRKIEIQPITVRIPVPPGAFWFLDSNSFLSCQQHERNRSVTFLKARPTFAIFATEKTLGRRLFSYLLSISISARMGYLKKLMNLVFCVLLMLPLLFSVSAVLLVVFVTSLMHGFDLLIYL